MRKKLPKCFISLGREGNELNISCIDTVNYDRVKNKVFIKDKYGINYTVEPSAVKGKIEL